MPENERTPERTPAAAEAGAERAAPPTRDGRAHRRRRRLTHLGTLGLLFAFLGVVLVARVTRAMPPDDITFVIGLGDGAPRIVLDPANMVLAIGVLFILAG